MTPQSDVFYNIQGLPHVNSETWAFVARTLHGAGIGSMSPFSYAKLKNISQPRLIEGHTAAFLDLLWL